ncbi:DUF4249 domain-containing protein [Pontibacter pamirensis]|uniref:DUF4249 domain-containing protein n=1 Tax=Pontibacter pamirensis TaxID=2562824 RepID=UPI001389F30F|nr:DUF4249 domain-containing protein [Pontibacter pamirensis]
MKLKHTLFFLLPFIAAFYGCDMDKDISIDLPSYNPQLVVEGYLEPGKPFRIAVQESASYFDAPTPPLVPDAEVVITHNGRRIDLTYKPRLDNRTGFLYTHSSEEIMNGKPGDIYGLEVTDGKGRKVTGFTTILPSVPIDTVEWRFNDEDEALLLTSFQDDANTENYYRYMTHRDSLTHDSDREFFSSDKLNNGNVITFGSNYRYERGSNLIVTLFNIEKQYYDFLSSSDNAKDSNGNPFAQPSRIRSSVQGGLGIFTNLAYVRKTIVIK